MAFLSLTLPPSPLLSPLKTFKTQQFQQPLFNRVTEDVKQAQFSSQSFFQHISHLCKEGQLREAVSLVTEMEVENVQVGQGLYGELLQGCVYNRDLSIGQQIHARILKNGRLYTENEFIQTKLVIFYAKCDILEVSDSLFSRLSVQNVFSWAAIIGLKCRMGLNEEALLSLLEMFVNGFPLDNFVIPNALKACGSNLQWIGMGKGIHGYAMKMGLVGCVYVSSSLVDMYGKCGVLDDAKKVFDKMIERNIVAWNSMLVVYVQNGLNEEALQVFYEMRMEGIETTRVAVSSILSASANLGVIEEGKQGHAIATLFGLDLDNILGSSLINFYSKIGLIEDAETCFSRIPNKDVVTWNLLISGYVQAGLVERALDTCCLMRSRNLRFDSVTLSSILVGSSDTGNLNVGKEGHCFCIRNNLESDTVVSSNIIDMYAKCGKVDYARRVFDSTITRDLVLWNTILAAYADVGRSGETLRLFYHMQLEGVSPNVISWNSVILGFLNNGQVNEAKDTFVQMQAIGVQPTMVTWTTLISGLARNGLVGEAIQIFQKMQEDGIKPNIVCIICLLSACTTLASLRYGRAIHGYIARHELSIATSLVNMYAKCGSIRHAKRVFNTILQKEIPVYNAMISSFALHGLASEALSLFRHLEEEGLEPDYITFTNALYACSHGGLVSEGLELFVDMVSKYEVNPSVKHFGCLVNILSKCGNLDEALRLLIEMPYKPDAYILGSLLTSCREHGHFELEEYLLKYLLQLDPENAGNYVALSNAYAAAGQWNEASKVRKLMKEKRLKKIPGCSWIEIEEEIHSFFAGDESHSKAMNIRTISSLLSSEIRVTG